MTSNARRAKRCRVSARRNFAVILLSKAMEVGRDHLIHRKRSPFPYEGKALARSKIGVTSPIGRTNSRSATGNASLKIAASEALPRCRDARRLKTRSLIGRLSLPLVGEGGPLAVDEVIPPAVRVFTALRERRLAKHCRAARQGKSSLILGGVLSFPLRGRGTAPRWMR